MFRALRYLGVLNRLKRPEAAFFRRDTHGIGIPRLRSRGLGALSNPFTDQGDLFG